MIDETLKEQIRELEFDFENEVKALEGIVYNNPSAVFFDVVLIKYDHKNNSTKKVNICKWNSSKDFKTFKKVLKRENVFFKNIVRKENVYVAVTQKTKLLNFIWLDDIKLENLNEQQLEYITLIETSPGNYQGFIKLDKLYTETEIQQIKNYLIQKLKADKAAKAKIQPMRFPGFYSYKREIPFYVKVYKTATKALDGNILLNKINNFNNMQGKEVVGNISQNSGASSGSWKEISYYKKQLGLSDVTFDPTDERDAIVRWAIREYDIDEEKVDNNIIDIMFVYQLVIRDYSENDIFLYLQEARDDLHDKHKAGDYFERTYLKALLFYKVFYPAKKLYENRLLNEYIEQHKNDWNESKKVVENLRVLIGKIT